MRSPFSPAFSASLMATALFVAATVSCPASGIPSVLHADTSGTTRPDAHIGSAAGAAGNWGAVWTSDAPIGTNFGILFQRSTNDGATWSVPSDISLGAGSAADAGDHPMLATDGSQTWIAAWDATAATPTGIDSARRVFLARSTDGGATFAAPVAVSTDATDPMRSNSAPWLATDEAGVWVAVWQAVSPQGSPLGADSDIMFSRSTDDGATWSAPAPLNANAATDKMGDAVPRVATDKTGNWVATWQTFGADDPTSKVLSNVHAARSTDNGVTWGAPVLVSASTEIPDPMYDDTPAIAWVGGNDWVLVWVSGETTAPQAQPGGRVWVARSTDEGATFGAPVCLNPGAAFAAASHPGVVTAGATLAVVWDEAVGGDGQPRLKAAFSGDAGVTWGAPGLLTTDPAGGGIRPAAAARASGRMLVAWPAGTVGRAGDYYYMVFDAAAAGISDWMLWR